MEFKENSKKIDIENINQNIYNEDNKNELNDINKMLVTEVEHKEEEKNSDKSEDSLLKYLSINKRVSEEDIKNSNLILIEEEKNCNLLNGKKLLINAGGLIEGGRRASDGIVIFSLKKNKKEALNGTNNDYLKFDFELNLEEDLPYPYIFLIYYENNQYYIRSYYAKGKDNRIIFLKLTNNNSFPIKQKEIISAGNVIFLVTPLENDALEIVNLSRKEISPIPKQVFDPTNKKEVTIGRNKECDFAFLNDKSFSRIQTRFEFNEEKKMWIMYDGSKNKPSTNGTWIFGTHSIALKGSMIFKILNYNLKITEIYKDKSEQI